MVRKYNFYKISINLLNFPELYFKLINITVDLFLIRIFNSKIISWKIKNKVQIFNSDN
jgi:hypothetical protein